MSNMFPSSLWAVRVCSSCFNGSFPKTKPCILEVFLRIIFIQMSISVSWYYVWKCFCVLSELLYNLTADVDKRQKSQPSRVYFTQSGSQISQMSQQLSLDVQREDCQRFTAYVKVRIGSSGLTAGPVCVAARVLSRSLCCFPMTFCTLTLQCWYVIWVVCLCGLFFPL